MRFRAVLALTHESERVLRRYEDPHGLDFQIHLLICVIRGLEQKESSKTRFWDIISALLALLLRAMGVVVTRDCLGEAKAASASVRVYK